LSIRFKINGTECIHDIDLGCVMIKTVDIQKRIYELISDKITRLVYHKLMVANKGNLI